MVLILAFILLGECTAGYFCNTTSAQPDQYVCPAGHYCPVGTDIPMPCPAGTYLGTVMNSEEADCVSCTAGSYCEGMTWDDANLGVMGIVISVNCLVLLLQICSVNCKY